MYLINKRISTLSKSMVIKRCDTPFTAVSEGAACSALIEEQGIQMRRQQRKSKESGLTFCTIVGGIEYIMVQLPVVFFGLMSAFVLELLQVATALQCQ
jgi:hypothetical protein